MLPRVDREQRHRALTMVPLVVVDLLDDDPPARRVPRRDCPAGALNRPRGFGQVTLEPLEATEVAVELRGDVAGWLSSAVGREVLPEQGVEDMT